MIMDLRFRCISVEDANVYNLVVKKLRTAVGVFRERGVVGLVKLILRKIFFLPDEINLAKKTVLEHIKSLHNNTVRYGPFENMQLAEKVWWGGGDAIPKILGTYERHIQDYLVSLKDKVQGPFIDIGAADGYFALGVLVGGLFDKTYAFEISEQGQEVLRNNAKQNGVVDNISVSGEANYDSLKVLVEKYESAAVLIDIESGEFDLLDDNMLDLLSRFYVIIEIHDRFSDEGPELKLALARRASDYFDVSFKVPINAPYCDFEELAHFSDNQRLLAFSENRRSSMEWMILTPR